MHILANFFTLHLLGGLYHVGHGGHLIEPHDGPAGSKIFLEREVLQQARAGVHKVSHHVAAICQPATDLHPLILLLQADKKSYCKINLWCKNTGSDQK